MYNHTKPTHKTPRPTRRAYAFRKKPRNEVLEIVLFLGFSYFFGTIFGYFLAHPEKTQAQIFLNVPKILMLDWNDEP
jgi:hypothetical protein